MVVVGDALHDGSDPLQARTGVDRRSGEWTQLAVGLSVELHEDEVPELEKPAGLRPLDERVVRKLGAPRSVHSPMRQPGTPNLAPHARDR